MYWPTTTARRLHVTPSGVHHEQLRWQTSDDGAGPSSTEETALPDEKPALGSFVEAGDVLHIARSHNRHLWAALTPDTLTIWSVRPAHIAAAVVRTPLSIEEYGANRRLHWQTDGRGIVIETDQSYLLLYAVHTLSPSQAQSYSYIPSDGSNARSRATREPMAPSLPSLRASFAPGAGEGAGTLAAELQGADVSEAVGLADGRHLALDVRFHLVLRIDAGLSAVLPSRDNLIVFTISPPAIQCIPWPDQVPSDDSSRPKQTPRTTLIERLDWIVREASAECREAPFVTTATFSDELNLFLLTTSDGRAYWAQLEFDTRTAIWRGKCVHGAPRRQTRALSVVPEAVEPDETTAESTHRLESRDDHAVTASINERFNLLAIGLRNGLVCVYNYRAFDRVAPLSHRLSIRKAMRSTASYLAAGTCTSLAWTSDGHALAVGWSQGWSVWSTFGKLMGCSLIENWHDASPRFSDHFMRGVSSLFWGPGNTDLFISSKTVPDDEGKKDPDGQLFVLPFAKSAIAGQHSPDNTRYAFVQLDDSVLVYRGSDQPDMSVINPESDVWHNIKIPSSYMAANWPIRYACISGDGRLIAVAGRKGLTHFSTLSGRWKTFAKPQQEQSFSVQGGLQWYQHVLVAACHVSATNSHEIRLYSRDAMLEDASVLYVEELPAAVVLTSLFDNSLLVYTADNTLHHYLIAILEHDIRLTLCGSITFEGVVGEPERVRGMSWLVPYSQQRFGDPMDDLMVATIIFLIDGKLVLLRPRRGRGDDEEEVSYDMQILGDHIEYYWTHLQGIGTLENSLWGYDGHGIKLWLDALTIEQADIVNDDEEDDDRPEYRTIEESVSIPLDFYPLCVLIEKGIIIGVEPEVSLRRSLEFAIFRSVTITKLFLQHIIRNYLERSLLKEAVLFASFYKDLIYFAHSLEMLLHDVLEDEADATGPPALATSSSNGSIVEHTTPVNSPVNLSTLARNADVDAEPSDASMSTIAPNPTLLPLVVAFLDHFDESLDVVVNCARKTEIARWDHLFRHVGEPRELFEICLNAGNYKTAGSYLLVLHNLEPLEESHKFTVRLLRLAREHGWTNLCKDLLRFSRSLDEEGRALQKLVRDAGLLEKTETSRTENATMRHSTLSNGYGRAPVQPRVPAHPATHRSVSAPYTLDAPIEEEEDDQDCSAIETSIAANSSRSPSAFDGIGAQDIAPRPTISVNGERSMAPRHGSPPHSSLAFTTATPSILPSTPRSAPLTSDSPRRARHGHVRHPESISITAGRQMTTNPLASPDVTHQ